MKGELTVTISLDSALLLLWILRTREDVYNDFNRLRSVKE